MTEKQSDIPTEQPQPKRCEPVIVLPSQLNGDEIDFGRVKIGEQPSDVNIFMSCQGHGESVINFKVPEQFELLPMGGREGWLDLSSAMINIDRNFIVRFNPDKPGRVKGELTFWSSDGTQIAFQPGNQRATTVTIRLVGEGIH